MSVTKALLYIANKGGVGRQAHGSHESRASKSHPLAGRW
jgi:hypothetical protein